MELYRHSKFPYEIVLKMLVFCSEVKTDALKCILNDYFKVGSYYRMNLKPYKTEETMKMMKVQRFDSAEKVAVTNYRVSIC